MIFFDFGLMFVNTFFFFYFTFLTIKKFTEAEEVSSILFGIVMMTASFIAAIFSSVGFIKTYIVVAKVINN
jgi:hypothetical protein